MGELAKLPNIGKTLEQQLLDAGIDSPDELRRISSREAWLRIQKFDPSACLHRLSALEGAVQGVRKTELDEGTKEELKQFYREHKTEESR